MILIGFLWFGAMLAIWLTIYAALRYGAPDSLAGRIATIIT